MRNELSLLRNMWPVVFLGTALVSDLPEGGHDRVAADGALAELPAQDGMTFSGGSDTRTRERLDGSWR